MRTHPPQHRQHQAASTGRRLGQRSTRQQLRQTATQARQIRARKSGDFFQVVADPADQAGPQTIRTYTHTPAGQRNTSQGTQAAHTTAPPHQEKPPTRQPGNIPPGRPGESGRPPAPGNQNTSAQEPPTRRRFNTQRARARPDQFARARPDQFARARARKGTARARAPVAGRCAQNFCRFGAKKSLPPPPSRAIEGG